MQRHFDIDLSAAKQELLLMGSITEKMVLIAIEDLISHDEDSLNKVDVEEQKVNDLHIKIDEIVIRLIALHQPVAKDLRFLIMATKINSELERIADMAVNTCQSIRRLSDHKTKDLPNEFHNMIKIVHIMLRNSLDAFAQENVNIARKVLDDDDKVDSGKNKIINFLVSLITHDPEAASWAVSLILISKNLERIADRCTNIAEEVIYLALGKEIRHQHKSIE